MPSGNTRESTKDVVARSIKTAVSTEVGIASSVKNLHELYKEEAEQQRVRLRKYNELFDAHNTTLRTFHSAVEHLEQQHEALAEMYQALGRERAALTEQRHQLRRVIEEYQRERQLLHNTIDKLDPGLPVHFFVAFLAAAFTLLGWTGLQLLAPVVARWASGS